MIYLLYGLRIGERHRYMEELLSEKCRTLKDVDKVIELAKQDGFHSFRISKFIEGEMPDFVRAVKKRR